MSRLDRFYDFVSRPLLPAARIILALAVVPLILSFFLPLWRISLVAPQYPQGLWLDIFSYTIEGGNDGQHLQEINTLNHYIGMAPISRAELSDLDWLPFAFGGLALLALRVAAIGSVRSLIDLFVLTIYAGGFGLSRFVYKLWVFGHNLDPRAPVDVEPFMPALFGTKQIANFTTSSWPQLGTFCVGLFIATVASLLAVHLFLGRKRAIADERRERTTLDSAIAPSRSL